MKKEFLPVKVEKDYKLRTRLMFHFGDKYRYHVVGKVKEKEWDKLFDMIRQMWKQEDSTDEPGTRFPLQLIELILLV